MSGSDPAIYPMIFWYSIGAYEIFDRVGYDQAKAIADVANDSNMSEPLLMRDKKGEFPACVLPEFGEVPGPHIVATMSAFLVWSQHLFQNTVGIIHLPESDFLKAAEDGYQLYVLRSRNVER